MHLSIWKSVILSWANALELVPTTSNFIGDLSPQFFIKLCSYLKGSDVSTLQDAVAFISDYYKSLILGDEGDENYETLLATGYLLLTSVHHPNDELCKRLCRVTNREQVQIKSALEAFMDIQPSKITKELLFKTLSQLPDEPESCGNSPYLGSSSSGSPKTGTPGTDEDTPHRRRRSSRFKKVKHQLRMTMTLKNSLQDELDYAREIISNLESSVSVKNQEISKLKEQNQLLLNQRDPEVSWSSSGCKTPVNNKYDCMKCISLERQICSFEEDALQDKSEIQRLNEALETFSKKISRIESEKRNLDIQLLSYEEQIVQNKNEMSDLQTHLTDLMTNKKELESIIEELKEARSAINCSIEEDIPNNLGYEIIDLQFSELKLSLEEKDRIICEKDENITALNEKLEKLELENKQFQQEAVDYQTSIFKLKEEITKYSNIICNLESEILKLTSSNDLLNSELQEVVLKKNVFEDGLRKSEEKLEELHNLIFDLKKQHECEKASLDAEIEDCKKIVNERDLMISSFQSTLKLEAIKQNELENRCLELETTISTKEEIIGSMKQQVQHVNESLVQEVELNTGLKEQCNNLQSTLVKKNAEISVLENKISQSQSLIQEKQKENELYQLNIHELDSSVKKLTNDYELVASQLMEVMKEKENIEHQYLESQSRIAAMTDELENRKIELQKLETTCEEREKVLLLKEETISSLEEEIIRFMEDVQQENEKNATLLQEIQSFKFEVSKLLTESDNKQKELEQCDLIRQEVENENLKFKGIIDELEGKVLELLDSNQQVNSKLRCTSEEKENVEKSLKKTEESVVELNEMVDNLKKQLHQNQILLEAALRDNEKIITERDQIISTLKSSLEAENGKLEDCEKRCLDLEKTIAYNKEIIGLLEQDVKNTKDSLQQELAACANLKKDYELSQSILAEKNAEISALESNVLQKQALIEEIEQKYEKTVAHNEEIIGLLEQDVKNTKDSLQQELAVCANLKKDYELSQSILAEKNVEISALESNVLKKQALIEEIEQKYEKTIAHNEEIIGLLEQDVKNTKDSLQQELAASANLKKDYELSQSILAEKNAEISALESNVLQKQALIEDIKQKYEKTIAHNEEIIGLLEQDMKNTKDSLQQELAASANLKKDYELSQSILAEINAEISALESNVLQKQALIEDIKQNYEKTIAHNKETIGLLEQDVKNAKDERKQVNDDIRNQLQKSEQQIGTLSLDLGTKMKDLQTMKILCDEQENVLLLKNEKLSSLEGEVVRLTEAIALVSEKNETLTQSIQTNQLELNRLETALDNYRKEIEYSDSTKQEMELEILKFKETVNTLEAEILKLTQSKEVADAKSIEILEQKKYLEERITILEKEVKEKVSNEEKLEQDMKALQAEFNKQLARALKMEEDKLCLENYKLSVEEEKSHMQSVIRSLQGEVERLTNEHDSVTLLASNLKCETESLNRRLNNCSMDLDIKNETILMMETTISSLNSKISHLEATIKEKDNFISDAKVDLNNTKKALEKLREESRKTLDRYVDELTFVIQQKDVELSELREENESNCERIAKMAEELVHVAQTFNIEKTSLVDHAKHLEEIIELSSSTEEQLQNKIESLSKQLGSKELRVTQLEEKLQLTVELHTCEKRELTTKNKFLQTQLDDNKSKYDRLVKDLEGSNWEHFKERNSVLETENLELKNKLELKNQDIQWYKHELEIVQKSAQNTVNVNAKLEEEVKSLTRSKKQEVTRLEKEIAMLTEKLERREPNVSDISTKLREEYEEKLERLKQKMSKIYTEKMGRMMKYQTGEEKMFADQALEREKQKRISLESKVRQLSDQLLILQEEKRALISNKIFRTPVYPFGGPISNPAYESPPLQKTHSLDRLPTTSHGLDNLGADCLDQSFSSRRTSTSSNRSNHVPKGIGKVFPAADEDGEVFDNRCLADLKEGICTLAPGPGGDDRLSILQQRNSMCPPHLKSSYPVESQFFAPNAKEDEIKVTARENKENQPQDSRYAVPGTPSKLRSLFSSMKHKHHHKH